MSAPFTSENAYFTDLDDQNISFDSSEFLSSTLNDDAIRLLNINEDSGISSDLSNDSIDSKSELSILLQGPIDFSLLMPLSSMSPPILPEEFVDKDYLEPAENMASTSLGEGINVDDLDLDFSIASSSSEVCLTIDLDDKENQEEPPPYAPSPFTANWPRKPYVPTNDETPSPLSAQNESTVTPVKRMFEPNTLKRTTSSILQPVHSFNDSGETKRIRTDDGSLAVSKLLRTTSTVEMGENHTQLESPDFKTIYKLALVNSSKADVGFRRISTETLAETLKLDDFLNNFILIDCRYPYEFNAGHIYHAINLYDPNELIRYFYPIDRSDKNAVYKKAPIFYCEYSSIRGPNMANELRKYDRMLNMKYWPALDFDEVYVLHEGYQHFYSKGRRVDNLCTPNAYVKMHDSRFSSELAKYKFHRRPSSMRTTSMRNLSIKPLQFNQPAQDHES